jgi:hypothetical protein
MLFLPGLPPQTIATADRLCPVANTTRLRIAGGVLTLLILGGCQGGANVARHERAHAAQAVAQPSKPAKSKNSRSQATAIAASDQKNAPPATDSKPADKPRRLIPEWFRLGQDKESVPLPTTPASDSETAAPGTGPVEQFQ